MTTSGPILSLWAQHQGFGPDVFILKCSNWISRRHHEHRGVFLAPNLRLDRPHVPSAWRRRCRPVPLGLKLLSLRPRTLRRTCSKPQVVILVMANPTIRRAASNLFRESSFDFDGLRGVGDVSQNGPMRTLRFMASSEKFPWELAASGK